MYIIYISMIFYLYDDDVEQMYFTNDYMIYFSNSSIKYENTTMNNL